MLLALLWGLGPAPVPAWAARASSNAGRSGRVGARVVPPPSAGPDSWGSLAPVPDFVAAGSADGERKGRQRELEALRNILQGDAFDKAIAREEEEREVDDERELLRAQREKRRRERAGEVAFLRSVAIRDAQMGDTLPGDPAAAGDHVCRDLNSDPASHPVHFQCGSGARVAGQQAGVGADAHSDPEMEDLGSTLSAQANIHAQQAVQSVLRGLRQESVFQIKPATLGSTLTVLPAHVARMLARAIPQSNSGTQLVMLHTYANSWTLSQTESRNMATPVSPRPLLLRSSRVRHEHCHEACDRHNAPSPPTSLFLRSSIARLRHSPSTIARLRAPATPMSLHRRSSELARSSTVREGHRGSTSARLVAPSSPILFRLRSSVAKEEGVNALDNGIVVLKYYKMF